VQVDLGSSQPIDTVALVPAIVDFQPLERSASGFPLRFRVDVSDDATFARFTPLLVHTTEDFPPPGVAPVVIPSLQTRARYLRVTVTRLAEANGTFFFALAELVAVQGNRNLALGAVVTASNSVNILPRWSTAFLVDGRTPLGPPIRRAPLPKFDALFACKPADGSPAWMAVDLGRERRIDEVRLHPLHARQGADVPGFRFPSRFRVDLAQREDFSDARAIFDSGAKDFPNPGNNPVTVPAAGRPARFVRVLATAPDLPTSLDFALSELEVQADGAIASLGCRVLSSGDPRRPVPRPLGLLTDGSTSFGELMELPVWLQQWALRIRLQAEVRAGEAAVAALRVAAERRLAWGAGAVGIMLAAGAGLAAFLNHRSRRREQEDFRTRLAQDLHDEVGSNLAGIAVLSETAALQNQSGHDQWREIGRIARESNDAMRETLWLVGARQAGGIDLAKHLQLSAARMLRQCEVRWIELPESLLTEWPGESRRQLFLFFKESLANIARHAHATQVELTARVAPPEFVLRIRDNGRGFDPAAANGGLGLASLRTRARALRGKLEIVSAPGAGTEVVLRVPLP
jgi:signal transduction histidine kinase